MSKIPGYGKPTVCPFNQSHLIMKERMQTHLVKCAKNYPDIVLKACPFNVCHLLKESELESHVLQCEDRKSYDLFKYKLTDGSVQNEEPKQSPQLDCDESWDDEEHQTYNPQAYVERANVLRTLNVATPSEKKTFREAERLRLRKFNDKMN